MVIKSVEAPAAYVPQDALAFGAEGANAVGVDPAHPLPTVQRLTAAASTPLAGTASTSASVGPFAPELGRPIWVTLAGAWTGTATVSRSVDGGATKLPLTVGGAAWGSFTAPAQEPVGEESEAAATWWLDIALVSGTLSYRVAQ